jgi:NADH dehydrogenase
LRAAQGLRRAPVEVVLLDRENHHLFQPLLYQVATGGLSPANIAAPLRSILRRQANARVLLADVVDIDVASRRVVTIDSCISYDTLVVAAGSRSSYFGHPEWENIAPSLKTLDDATLIRRKVLLAFEAAEQETDPDKRAAWITFVLVGGGPTGMELAGMIAELAHHTLRRDFRAIDPAEARIVLIEGLDRVLPTYPPDLSSKAKMALERLGAEVWTGSLVTEVTPDFVLVKRGDREERIRTRSVLWTAGVAASPLGRIVAQQTGAQVDRAGRVLVEPDLTVPGRPEIFVVGDLAHFQHGDLEAPLPAIAPVAMQQGSYVARAIQARLRGKTLPPFRYHHRGDMATIGRGAAVANIGRLRFAGYLAWLLWLFVHLLYLVQFQNRLLVLVQWAYSYITRNRAARLITGPSPFPFDEEHRNVAERIAQERRLSIGASKPARDRALQNRPAGDV